MGKVETNKEKKRLALEEAAYKLFSAKGVQNTSISDIADEAGIAKGTFYLYFNDKYEIANQLIYKKTGALFKNAVLASSKIKILTLEDEVIVFAENLMAQLRADLQLMEYCSRCISWDSFKNMIDAEPDNPLVDFPGLYNALTEKHRDYDIDKPQILFFLVVTISINCCYNPIKFSKPCSFEEVKPYIAEMIKSILPKHIRKKTANE